MEYRSVSHPYKRRKNGRTATCSEHIRTWILEKGDIPEGHIIHHINGNKMDNRIENLACVTRSEHAKIHSKKPKI